MSNCHKCGHEKEDHEDRADLVATHIKFRFICWLCDLPNIFLESSSGGPDLSKLEESSCYHQYVNNLEYLEKKYEELKNG